MPRRVSIHHGIVVAIRIQVQAMYGFGVEIVHRIGRDESSRFGVVVSRLQIIKLRFLVVIIPSVALLYHTQKKFARSLLK